MASSQEFCRRKDLLAELIEDSKFVPLNSEDPKYDRPAAVESGRLYVGIADGVLILVDKALEIYWKAGEQAQRLSEFFEMCRGLEFGQRQKYVKIE